MAGGALKQCKVEILTELVMGSLICRWAIAVISLTFPHLAFSQKNIQYTNQQWIQYYQQLELNKHSTLMTDGGFRWSDGERLQYIARMGWGYNLGDRLRVAGGIASTGSYDSLGLRKFEIRPYQELLVSGISRIPIQHRVRVEERYIRDVVNGDLLKGHNFNFRFRYQVSASLPLIGLSKTNADQKLLLTVSNEIFINAGKEIIYNVLDKNRIVIGPALQFNKNLNVGLVYNFQFTPLNAPANYSHDHVLWLTAYHNMKIQNRQQ